MRCSLRIKYFLPFFIALLLFPLRATLPQIKQLRFERVSSEEGPAQSLITAIFQDRTGYLWFGTYDGLYKYNGYTFKVYKNRAFDTASISGNYIQAIIEDHKGNIWIGTQSSGISKFDKISGNFTNYMHDPRNKNSLISNRTWAIAEDSKGSIWIGTSEGLDRFNPENGRFEHFRNDPEDPFSLSNNAVNALHEDNGGILWIGTFGKGLCFLNLNKFYSSGDKRFGRIIFHYNSEVDPGLNRIKFILENKTDYLWLATYGGLIKFNRFDNSYKIYFLKSADNIIPNQNALLALAEDKEGNIWAGSHNYGLCQFNKESGSFYIYGKNTESKFSLNDVYIPSLYIDKTGIMWVGTGRGINKVLPYYRNFLNLSHVPSDSTSLGSNEVNTIFEDSDGNIWVGTWGGGLSKYDKKNHSFKNFTYEKNNSNSLPDNTVWCISELPHKNLLIGTYSGLTKFNLKTKKFTRKYLKDAQLSHYNISTILYDKFGDLWVGTYGGGLNRLKKGTKKFIYYKFDPNDRGSISDNFITSLYEDKKGTLWIGTHAGGLDSFDRDTDSFVNYRYNPGNKFSITNNNIRCITEDGKGNLWIGTWGGGLDRYDEQNQKFYHYTEKEGLANNLVFGILEDSTGNLWIGTNKGLSELNVETGKFTNYRQEDGLGSEQFSYGYLKSSDGLMYFGGTNGLTVFNPRNLKTNENIPPVVITSFKKYNSEINFKEEILNDKMISLEYLNNEFTIGFAALDYTSPSKNNYAFKLEGYDKYWTYSQNVHSAHYTNLKPGIYNFHVRASNNDNVWNDQGASILIRVIPPFWDTLWFKVTVVILLLLIIYLAYRLRIKSIATRNEMLEELVGKRTKELESEIFVRKKAEEAVRQSEEKLKILNANKDKFFSIISHDLKSPFFSLLGYGSILESDFENFSEQETKEIITNMNSVIRKLSDLTENLLQWAKVQTGKIGFSPQNVELEKLIEKPLSLLMLSAADKKINLINNVNSDCRVNVDVNMMSSVIQNLITNAIKFSKPYGKIEISCAKNGRFVEITVKDDGVGISEENLGKLFKIEEHYTTKGTKDETGSGLGLILCKEFVEKNGGEIRVESEEGKGTAFRITMPFAF